MNMKRASDLHKMTHMSEAPNKKLVDKYLRKWEELINYQHQEEALSLLFSTLYPQNKERVQILLKVSILNDFYSTNIFDTYSMAEHIHQLDIDPRLKAADLSLVGEIASISIKEKKEGGKKRRFYSFATKYCSHHNPDHYPIYDSYVAKMLLFYGKKDGSYWESTEKGGKSILTQAGLRNYKCFVWAIKKFRSFYRLEDYNLKQIDKFLWLAGKEFFPRNY